MQFCFVTVVAEDMKFVRFWEALLAIMESG